MFVTLSTLVKIRKSHPFIVIQIFHEAIGTAFGFIIPFRLVRVIQGTALMQPVTTLIRFDISSTGYKAKHANNWFLSGVFSKDYKLQPLCFAIPP